MVVRRKSKRPQKPTSSRSELFPNFFWMDRGAGASVPFFLQENQGFGECWTGVALFSEKFTGRIVGRPDAPAMQPEGIHKNRCTYNKNICGMKRRENLAQ